MFSEKINPQILTEWRDNSYKMGSAEVIRAIFSDRTDLSHMAALLSPAAQNHLEDMALRAKEITNRRFGKSIQLYTPIYLSNYCENSCLYCGFRKESKVQRKFQQPQEVELEAAYLKNEGFKNLLLVSGDDKKVSIAYLADVLQKIRQSIPSLSLEISPKSVNDYKKLCDAGADGVVVYQETYDRQVYEKYHLRGKKTDYNFRLNTPERVAEAGFHRVGIGSLIGLGDFRFDGLALFSHAQYLMKQCWQTQVTISLPRIQKAEDSIAVPHPVDNKKFIQLICALRIGLPDIGIVLSTREHPILRDGLINIAVTQISAGSRTQPGGYLAPGKSGEQFCIQDTRSPVEIAKRLKNMGFYPVWKDWEGALNDTV